MAPGAGRDHPPGSLAQANEPGEGGSTVGFSEMGVARLLKAYENLSNTLLNHIKPNKTLLNRTTPRTFGNWGRGWRNAWGAKTDGPPITNIVKQAPSGEGGLFQDFSLGGPKI